MVKQRRNEEIGVSIFCLDFNKTFSDSDDGDNTSNDAGDISSADEASEDRRDGYPPRRGHRKMKSPKEAVSKPEKKAKAAKHTNNKPVEAVEESKHEEDARPAAVATTKASESSEPDHNYIIGRKFRFLSMLWKIGS